MAKTGYSSAAWQHGHRSWPKVAGVRLCVPGDLLPHDCVYRGVLARPAIAWHHSSSLDTRDDQCAAALAAFSAKTPRATRPDRSIGCQHESDSLRLLVPFQPGFATSPALRACTFQSGPTAPSCDAWACVALPSRRACLAGPDPNSAWRRPASVWTKLAKRPQPTLIPFWKGSEPQGRAKLAAASFREIAQEWMAKCEREGPSRSHPRQGPVAPGHSLSADRNASIGGITAQ